MIELQEGETVFSRASEELDARGWTQQIIEDHGGRVCLKGAINCAVMGGPKENGSEDEWRAILDAAEKTRRRLNQSIFIWNDTPGRTKAEVQALLMQLHEEELANA